MTLPAESDYGWLDDAHWIEMTAPSKEEIEAIRRMCALPLPNTGEIDELEASSHHLTYDQGFQVNCLQHMPELGWPWGYPLALGLILITGLSPYRYFKHKGWL